MDVQGSKFESHLFIQRHVKNEFHSGGNVQNTVRSYHGMVQTNERNNLGPIISFKKCIEGQMYFTRSPAKMKMQEY